MADKRYDGEIRKLNGCRWELPRDPARGMLTNGVLYATEPLFRQAEQDATLWQLANVACLPGIVGPAMAMPDCHYGYGFPIGGVAATDVEEGVISSGGVGYDINCGVRLLRSSLTEGEVRPLLRDLVNQIFRDVPCGVGGSGRVRLGREDMAAVLRKGAAWVVAQGWGTPADLANTEESGAMSGADPDAVSLRARERGGPQLGSLGSGNHFLEIQVVDQIYDAAAADVMGIGEPGQVTVMIHCGSRGLGHQVCDDAIEVMQSAVGKYGIEVPDPQLACVPVRSEEGQQYFAAMAAAANFAWANRQAIADLVRRAFERVLRAGSGKLGMDQVWDVAHNIAKFEVHPVDGRERRLCVHRKGATRAFGPGQAQVPEQYRAIGQPVLVPGDMGTASYVLLGTDAAMAQTWGSACHGAGRRLSRTAALKRARGEQVARELEARGILVRSAGKKTLAEEAPEAYKDVDEVIETCEQAGIARKVARMVPIAVVKG